MEELFRAFPWIINTEVWYIGWENENPTYRNHPWHAEALEITYEADEIDYSTVLDYFFRIHDPTTLNQQGNDRGTSYRSAIFFQNKFELEQAEKFEEKLKTLMDKSEDALKSKDQKSLSYVG